jgi:hypothetical protein
MQAMGFTRIIAGVQIAAATLFTMVATYRAAHAGTGHAPFGPRNSDCAVTMFFMLLLFGITVITDLVRQSLDKRSME